MKKIFIILFTVILTISALTIFANAEDLQAETEAETKTEEEKVDENVVSEYINKISNSSYWVTVGAVLVGIAGAVATFAKKFGVLIGLIRDKADAKEVNECVKKLANETSEEFNKKFDEFKAQAEAQAENEKLMYTVLTLFISNAKINPNAKAEIMKYITGLKEIDGTVAEEVEKTNKVIQELNKAEEVQETPAINRIEEEVKPEMILE